MKSLFPLLLITFVQGCSSLSASNKPSLTPDFCPANAEYFNIKRHDNRALTVCPIGSESSCHSDFYLQAYEQQEVDLNDDSLKDFVVLIQSGLVGINHDVNYYAVYLACAKGRYRRILFDAFTTMEITKKSSNGIRIINATRSCYNDISRKLVENKYSIEYNAETQSYGLPNNDERLRDFCGAYELSLPSSNKAE